MNSKETTLLFKEAFLETLLSNGSSILDSNWIKWKMVDGKIIGKRCVSSNGGFRYTWLEDVEGEVHSWLCGKDADYTEELNYENYKQNVLS